MPFQDLEKKRIEWVGSIRDAALTYNLKIRNLDQKDPSFEFAGWRVNIEHMAEYDSAVLMWTLRASVPIPACNHNWVDVAPSVRAQGWSHRRKINPRDLHILLFELQECLQSEGNYRSLLEKNVLKAMAMPSSEREAQLNVFSRSSPRFYEVKTRVFNRNPYVVAEVLLRAKGICEACGSSAPFRRRSDNTPYLEVHHLKPLADGGDDTVANAIGVCPNCHRAAHFG
ncbi:HNH endonuclease signature motif containing protein [Caballeronia sp. NCTM1]|uniref:HNH endonuclease n=1 Tax=Caballeronia sp. NCTM1 TaxID=2921753 RepID=UPI002029714D|nr:HNH endonuclease signature motif containing protein [Caballeronia sp. NCTM1]